MAMIQEMRAARQAMLEAVHEDGFNLQQASKEMRSRREVVLAAVKRNGGALAFASEELRSDPEVVLEAIKQGFKQNAVILHLASEELRADRKFVLAAISQNAFALAGASEKLRADREVVLQAVKQGAKQKAIILDFASKELRVDREFVLQAVSQNGRALGALMGGSEELRADREIVLEALKQGVQQNASILENASQELRADREFVLAAVKQNAFALAGASEELRADREVVLEAVRQGGKHNAIILDHASEELRADRNFVLDAIRQNGRALAGASEEVRGDREVVLEAVKQGAKQNAIILEYASKDLRADRDFVLEAIKHNSLALGGALEEVRADRVFMLEVIKRNQWALRGASQELRADRVFVLKAIKQKGWALRGASEELCADREFVLEAVKLNGWALKCASKELRADREVVLAAVKQNGLTLYYASKELSSDQEVVLHAIEQCGFASEFASELRADREFVLRAVRQNGLALQFASEELRSHREVVLEAIKQAGRALEYASQKLRADRELVLEAVKRAGRALRYASKELRADREVLRCAIEQDESALDYASEEVRAREAMVADFREHEAASKCASKAVDQSSDTRGFSCCEIRNDKQVFVEEVNQKREVFGFSLEEILDSNGVVIEATEKSSLLSKVCSACAEKLANDKDGPLATLHLDKEMFINSMKLNGISVLCSPNVGNDLAPNLRSLESAMPSFSVVESISEDATIEYLTDVEGNWNYFLFFVSISKVLYWDGNDRGAWGPGLLCLRDRDMLVFGGDACDKGPGDIRFTKTLLSLKERYPARVHIILGNRDVNKLRFFAELVAYEETPAWLPYWAGGNNANYEQFLVDENMERGVVSFTHWMLNCNMGCQTTTFQTRQHELALISGKEVSDADVVNSFRESVNPNGADPWMLTLLRVGQLGVVLGDILFVHGGLCDESINFVPGEDVSAPERCVQDWILALNNWKDTQVLDFTQRPFWQGPGKGPERERGGKLLIDYGTPGGCNGTSVMYFNPFENGNAVRRSAKVEDFLASSNVRRLVSGHQPHGQSPSVVRHLRTNLLALSCDTSYSDMGAFKVLNKADNRGGLVTSLRFKGPLVYLEGVLYGGIKHQCKLHVDPCLDTLPDGLVGRQLTDGSWVKTVVDDGRQVQAALGKGYEISTTLMCPERACLLLRKEYVSPEEMFRVNMREVRSQWLRRSFACRSFNPDHEGYEKYDAIGSSTYAYKADEFMVAETIIMAVHGVVDHLNEVNGKKSAELQPAIIANINAQIARGKRVLFVTNDSTRSRIKYAEYIQSLGIELRERNPHLHVLTTSFTCAWFLKRSMSRRPFVLCSETGILDELREMGITDYVATINDEGKQKPEYQEAMSADQVTQLLKQHGDIDAVVMGWDQHLSTLKIAVAASYLKWSRGGNLRDRQQYIPFITCSRQIISGVASTPADFCQELHLDNRRIPGVGNGAMAQIICGCAGLEQGGDIDVGKPSDMMLEALRRPESEDGYGVDLSKAVMVGDGLDTDIEFANAGGMRSLLVLTGVTDLTSFENGLRNGMPRARPTWVLNSLADI